MATEALAPTEDTSQDIPKLWVLSIVRSGKAPDITSAFRAMGFPAERSVVISEFHLHVPSIVAQNKIVTGADRDADLWNAGLEYIACQHGPGDLWDVLLIDPESPMTLAHANSLRRHMRMLDVWMAEPDIFGITAPRPYQIFRTACRDELHPQAAVISGEMRIKFDRRYYDASDSWVDFCRRNRAIGGSVLVSEQAMTEIYQEQRRELS